MKQWAGKFFYVVPSLVFQELATVPRSQAAKASTAFAGLWDLQSDISFWVELKLCMTYEDMVDKLESVPGNGSFASN